jgi:MFS family permease
MSTAALGTADPSATSAMATTTRIHPRALLRACGGPRYAVALAVDALGTGLLRPLLLLYGVTVLRLSAPVTGTAMTAGVVAGLVCMPAVGRWLDRGARGTVVAASMLVRVLGVALLLATPTGNGFGLRRKIAVAVAVNRSPSVASSSTKTTTARGCRN